MLGHRARQNSELTRKDLFQDGDGFIDVFLLDNERGHEAEGIGLDCIEQEPLLNASQRSLISDVTVES